MYWKGWRTVQTRNSYAHMGFQQPRSLLGIFSLDLFPDWFSYWQRSKFLQCIDWLATLITPSPEQCCCDRVTTALQSKFGPTRSSLSVCTQLHFEVSTWASHTPHENELQVIVFTSFWTWENVIASYYPADTVVQWWLCSKAGVKWSMSV